jgi:hypothetical protein
MELVGIVDPDTTQQLGTQLEVRMIIKPFEHSYIYTLSILLPVNRPLDYLTSYLLPQTLSYQHVTLFLVLFIGRHV